MPTLFARKAQNGLVAVVSLIAMAAVVLYIGGSSPAIAAKMTAHYVKAKPGMVQGVVKGTNGRPDASGRVVVVFRNTRGRIIKRMTVKVNRKGDFAVAAPAGAKRVALTTYLKPGQRAPHGTQSFRVTPGKSLVVTVVFHNSGHGILPAVFPY